jgi:hypothetical protein
VLAEVLEVSGSAMALAACRWVARIFSSTAANILQRRPLRRKGVRLRLASKLAPPGGVTAGFTPFG